VRQLELLHASMPYFAGRSLQPAGPPWVTAWFRLLQCPTSRAVHCNKTSRSGPPFTNDSTRAASMPYFAGRSLQRVSRIGGRMMFCGFNALLRGPFTATALVNSGTARPSPRGAPQSYAGGPAPTRRPWPTSPDSVPTGGWPCREEPSHAPIVGHRRYSPRRSAAVSREEPGPGWATSLRCGSESGPRIWCSASHRASSSEQPRRHGGSTEVGGGAANRARLAGRPGSVRRLLDSRKPGPDLQRGVR
jgi:hypothetical protein